MSSRAGGWVLGGGWARAEGGQPTQGICTKQAAGGRTRGFSQKPPRRQFGVDTGGKVTWATPPAPTCLLCAESPKMRSSRLQHRTGRKNRDLALGQQADSCQLSSATCWTVRGTQPEEQASSTPSSCPSLRTGPRVTDSTGRSKEASLCLSQVPQLPPPSLPSGLQDRDGYGVEVLSGVWG